MICPGNRRAAGLEWTQGETAAHLIVALRAHTDALSGDLGGWEAYVPELDALPRPALGDDRGQPRRHPQPRTPRC